MNWFLLTPTANAALAFSLISVTFVFYLISIKRKEKATKVLIVYFVLLFLQMVFGFFWLSAYQPWQRIMDTLQGVFLLFALVGYLHFSYVFLGDTFPVEKKRILIIVATLVLLLNSYNLYEGISVIILQGTTKLPGQLPRYNLAILTIPIVFSIYIWVIGVFFRKSVRMSMDAYRLNKVDLQGIRKWFVKLSFIFKPETRAASGMKSMGILTFAPILFFVSILLQRFGFISSGIHQFTAPLSMSIFLIGFVLLYVNYSPESTTFQVKLVGLTLVTVLLVILISSTTIISNYDVARSSGNVSADHVTLRFRPTDSTSYVLDTIPLDYKEAHGEKLQLSNDSNVMVRMPFSFTFYGNVWREIYISANGALSFGGQVNPTGDEVYLPVRDYHNVLPKIAPLFLDLNPSAGEGVFYKQSPEEVTVTWYKIPVTGTTIPNTIQVVLKNSGEINFNYAGVLDALTDGIVGIYPGGEDARSMEIPEGEKVALSGLHGFGMTRNFGLRYREFLHDKVSKISVIIFAAYIFVLTLFPLFFRSSLVVPLNALLRGVRHANAGDLSREVPVVVKDEIGVLSANFNQMIESLKQAAETKERMILVEKELGIAKRIQMSTLPSTFPAFPDHSEVDLYATMKPAKEVGGDFYDFFTIDENRVGVAIGDVSGKGIGSAMFMAIVRTMLHTTALQGLAPEQCLRHVNRVLYPENQACMFVTMFYGILNTTTGKFTYCNAGHNPPMYFENGVVSDLEPSTGISVCLLPDYGTSPK